MNPKCPRFWHLRGHLRVASDAAQRGDFEAGLRLEGASLALVERLGGGAPDALMGVLAPQELGMIAGVPTDAIDGWLGEGRALTENAAIALARELAAVAD